LGAIRDGKLYRLRYNFGTFEEYCEERWDLGKIRPYQLIDAANFAAKVHNCELSMPSRESHIRPLLARLEVDDDRIAVWGDVLASTNGAKIKRPDVDQAIKRFAWRTAPACRPWLAAGPSGARLALQPAPGRSNGYFAHLISDRPTPPRASPAPHAADPGVGRGESGRLR
jgi:hypothetical protein